MALFIPTVCNIDAEDLAHIFLSQVFAKHGTPTNIVSNWGKHFISCFGDHPVSCWESKPNFQLPTTQKPMVKLNGSTRFWNSTCGCTSSTNRMTGSTSSPPGQVCVQQHF